MHQIIKFGYYYWNSAKEVVTKKLKPQPQGGYPVKDTSPGHSLPHSSRWLFHTTLLFWISVTSFSPPSLLMSLTQKKAEAIRGEQPQVPTNTACPPPPCICASSPLSPPISVNNHLCVSMLQLLHYTLIPSPCTYSNTHSSEPLLFLLLHQPPLSCASFQL